MSNSLEFKSLIDELEMQKQMYKDAQLKLISAERLAQLRLIICYERDKEIQRLKGIITQMKDQDGS